MARGTFKGVIVASGTWFYDGTIKVRTFVVARDSVEQASAHQSEGKLRERVSPAQPGPDGLFYYVSGRGPFATIDEAKAWAENAWGPIHWDGPAKRFFLRLFGFLGAVP